MRGAAANGKLRGRKPALSPTKEQHMVELYQAGSHAVAQLRDLYDIGRSTV